MGWRTWARLTVRTRPLPRAACWLSVGLAVKDAILGCSRRASTHGGCRVRDRGAGGTSHIATASGAEGAGVIVNARSP